MKIGATLHLSMKNQNSGNEFKLRCKIIDMDENHLFIDYPINERTSKTEFIPVNTFLTGIYTDSEKVPLYFPTRVTKKLKLTVPALAIEIPEAEKIKRIQRREYVRVQAAIDIAVHSDNQQFVPFTTVSSDISGGGISIVLPKNTSLGKGFELTLWMVLPMNSGKAIYIKIKGEMIREIKRNEYIRTASIRFTTITSRERQQIIRFCFEKQREARLKELNM